MIDNNNSFKESIPGKYDHYLGPYIFEPFAEYITSRMKGKPQRVLEIAAGTGRVTRHIAEKIGIGAKLLATDINPYMLGIARQRVHVTNVEFQLADAQELPFPGNYFDCVICQFGFMFLPDRQKGFNEAYRVLKPGGQFLFDTWDKAENNKTVYITQQEVIGYLKDATPSYYGRPYSMFEPAELKEHLTVAGFENATVEKVTLIGESPSAMHIASGFIEGNAVINEIMKGGEVLLESMKASIAAKINQQVSKDPVRSELNAWVGEAFK